MTDLYTPTGRYLVPFKAGREAKAIKLIRSVTGLSASRVYRSRSRVSFVTPPEQPERIVSYSKVRVVVVDATQTHSDALNLAASDPTSPILGSEPEYWREAQTVAGPPPYADDGAPGPGVSWGLKAVGVDASSPTGADVKLAVLDTGLDRTHDDWVDRVPDSRCRNFAAGAGGVIDPDDHDDRNGHGTSTAGVAAGRAAPASTPEPVGGALVQRRYGVAPEAKLYVCRVLGTRANRAGTGGKDAWMIAAVDAMLSTGVDIILIPAGGPSPTAGDSLTYNQLGDRAIESGCLIVAAAGNTVARGGPSGPVLWPAKARGFMAVGAVNHRLRLPNFSPTPTTSALPRELVNVVGPGVGIWSSWLKSGTVLETFTNGTSLACAFVAGIAALRHDASAATPVTGAALWNDIVATAQTANLGPDPTGRRFGAGLAVAP
jgi:subtilisin family serine protease